METCTWVSNGLPIKWIGRARNGFCSEESHGFAVGTYARDKDGAVACMLLAELAAHLKQRRQSLHEKLEALYWQHGYHAEHTLNIFMEGSEGMGRMTALMKLLRERPPQSLAGLAVQSVRDYRALTVTNGKGQRPLEAPSTDMIILDLAAEGNYAAIRPSGTEPKVKIYLFTFVPAEMLHDLDAARAQMAERIQRIGADFQALVKTV
jgi:phosphomannomutase